MAASNANTKSDAMTATTIITVFDTPLFGVALAGCGELELEVGFGPELIPELGLEPGAEPAVEMGCKPPDPVALLAV